MQKGLAMILALLCVLPFFSARGDDADTSLSAPKMRALLIGCDHFLTQPDTWPAADSNVHLISDTLLCDSRGYDRIRLFSDSVGTVSALEEAVRDTFAGAGERDVSLLYISTHGVFEEQTSNANAALVLSDGTEEEKLYAPALQNMLDRVPGRKVLILDACNSGAFIGKGLSGGADRVFFTGLDYKVLCSAGGSEASWYFQGADPASGGASYFATVLADGCGYQGDYAADVNADGQITLTEMMRYLRENYAASTPQAYPQNDGEFVLFSFDPENDTDIRKAVTDITFEDTLITAGKKDVSFSFTVRRPVELYYQIIYHEEGAWRFSQAQQFLDGEQEDGTVLPGRKMRTLEVDTGDAYGYAIIQLITLEEGRPVLQGARLLCVQPDQGEVKLNVATDPAFVPGLGQELCILAQHDVPCGLTVSILDAEGRVVRRLAYEAPSRPQQLSPNASSFYWDGYTAAGERAPEGVYTVQVRVRLGGRAFLCESGPVALIGDAQAAEETENPLSEAESE